MKEVDYQTILQEEYGIILQEEYGISTLLRTTCIWRCNYCVSCHARRSLYTSAKSGQELHNLQICQNHLVYQLKKAELGPPEQTAQSVWNIGHFCTMQFIWIT